MRRRHRAIGTHPAPAGKGFLQAAHDPDTPSMSIQETGPADLGLAVRVAEDRRLRGCEVHMTHIPTPGDDTGLRRLGVNLTCDPQFATSNLFVG